MALREESLFRRSYKCVVPGLIKPEDAKTECSAPTSLPPYPFTWVSFLLPLAISHPAPSCAPPSSIYSGHYFTLYSGLSQLPLILQTVLEDRAIGFWGIKRPFSWSCDLLPSQPYSHLTGQSAALNQWQLQHVHLRQPPKANKGEKVERKGGRGWDSSLTPFHKPCTDPSPVFPTTASMRSLPIGVLSPQATLELPNPPWGRAHPEFVIQWDFLTVPETSQSTIEESSFVNSNLGKIGFESRFINPKEALRKSTQQTIETMHQIKKISVAFHIS